MEFQLLAKGIALAGCAIGAGLALIAGIGPGIGAVSYTHLFLGGHLQKLAFSWSRHDRR